MSRRWEIRSSGGTRYSSYWLCLWEVIDPSDRSEDILLGTFPKEREEYLEKLLEFANAYNELVLEASEHG